MAEGRCGQCGGAGWVIDCRLDQEPAMLELLPCLLPDCPASGRDVEHLSLRHEIGFTRAVVGPDGIVMAVGK